MDSVTDNIIIESGDAEIEYGDYEYSHNCGEEDKCKQTFLLILFTWKYDTKLTIEIEFNLSIYDLYKLSQQTLYENLSVGQYNHIVIENSKYRQNNNYIVINQSKNGNELETIIEFFNDCLKINDNDMIISKYILQRLNTIYNDYLKTDTTK